MRLSVYLSDLALQELYCIHPNRSLAVDAILYLGEIGCIELEQLPPPPPRDGDKRVEIEVTNQFYLQLLTKYNISSAKTSLRRIIYWALEQGVYEEYSDVIADYFASRRGEGEQLDNHTTTAVYINRALNYMRSAYTQALVECHPQIDTIEHILKELSSIK